MNVKRKHCFVFLVVLAVGCSKKDVPESALPGSEQASKTGSSNEISGSVGSSASASVVVEEKVEHSPAVIQDREASAFSGTIAVIDPLRVRVDKKATLFVFVKNPETGQMVALKRYPNPVFPFDYQITKNDIVAPSGVLEGAFIVSARLDKDGVAGDLQSGDLSGVFPANPIQVGAKSVHIVLDTIQP